MKNYILIILLSFLFVPVAISQNVSGYVVKAFLIEDDTLISINLPEYCVNAKTTWKIRRSINKNNKLVYNVKKVYPYAKLAGIKLNEYEDILINAESDRERKKLMKLAEKELKDEFEVDLKKLTFKQGAILIKLVDRETGDSSYVLVQELRGKFVAFFWQTFARLFGYNLKTKYDPLGEDKEIENIVDMIEKGQI